MSSIEIETSDDFIDCDDDHRIASLLDEYLQGVERGDAMAPEQFLAQHPDLAEPLREYLDGIRILENAAGSIREYSSTRVNNLAPRQLGDYLIGKEIGRGGMGIVYEATQISLGREVALKVLPFAAVLDPKQIQRFQNEAQAAARLHHPHIVPVFAVGCERSTYFYSMQKIDGKSLDHAIAGLRASNPTQDEHTSRFSSSPRDDLRDAAPSERKGELSTVQSIRNRSYTQSIARIGLQAAQALAYAHECGVVHRDVKPSNLIVDQAGKLWITDFGLAHTSNDSGLTLSGDIVGTFRYMSPEQASGKSYLVDHRTDIYSLGATLYELLTLQPMHGENDLRSLRRQIEENTSISARRLNPAISTDFETILLKATALEKEDRYASATDFANDLQCLLDGKPVAAKRPSLLDRVRRRVIRHPIHVATMIVVMICLSTLAVAFAIFASTKNREIRSAQLDADHHLQVAHEVVQRFGTRVIRQLEEMQGSESVRYEILSDSIRFYDSYRQYATSKSWLDEAITAEVKTAYLNEQLGRMGMAEEAYRSIIRKLENGMTATSDSKEVPELRIRNLAFCKLNLSCLLLSRGDLDSGEVMLQEAMQLSRRSAVSKNSATDLDRLFLLSILRASQSLGIQSGKGEPLLTEAFPKLRDLYQTGSLEPSTTEPIGRALLASSYTRSFQPRTRVEAAKIAILFFQSASDKTSSSASQRHGLAQSHMALAMAENEMGLRESALQVMALAIESLEQLSRDYPKSSEFRNDLGVARNNQGKWYLQSKDWKNAECQLERARADFESTISETESANGYSGLAAVLHNLALLALGTHDQDDARDLLNQAIHQQEIAMRIQPTVAAFRNMRVEHQAELDRLQGVH